MLQNPRSTCDGYGGTSHVLRLLLLRHDCEVSACDVGWSFRSCEFCECRAHTVCCWLLRLIVLTLPVAFPSGFELPTRGAATDRVFLTNVRTGSKADIALHLRQFFYIFGNGEAEWSLTAVR